MTDTTVPYTYTTSPDTTGTDSTIGEVLEKRPIAVKFFSCSYMKMDEMEAKINKFCKEHDVIKVDFLELSELVIVMIVYK